MEGERFDHLARHIGQGRTRRSVVALLAGGLGGPLAAQLAPAPVEAACRKLNESCTKKRPKIGKRRKCCSGLVCRNKRCRIKECSAFLGCGEGKGCCDGKCVDLQTDESNCGACGEACPAGATCVESACSFCKADGENCQGSHQCCDSLPWGCLGGVCRNTCGTELTWCGDRCTNIDIDPANCGACGRACATGLDCLNGRCCERFSCCRDYGEACASEGECCDTPCTGGACCRPLHHRCSYPEECCSGFCTGTGGFCCPPGGDCCQPYGSRCNSASDCCLLNDGSPIPCSGGLCRFN